MVGANRGYGNYVIMCYEYNMCIYIYIYISSARFVRVGSHCLPTFVPTNIIRWLLCWSNSAHAGQASPRGTATVSAGHPAGMGG